MNSELNDEFKGDDNLLISCIESLIYLNDQGCLVPHGIGGHARKLLSAAACRLQENSRMLEWFISHEAEINDKGDAFECWYSSRDSEDCKVWILNHGLTSRDAIHAAMQLEEQGESVDPKKDSLP